LCSTVVGTLLGRIVVAGGGEVNVGLTSIDQRSLLGLQSSSSIGGLVEVDVAEALGPTSGLIRDNTSTRDLAELLELTVQPLVIDVPAQITDEQIGGSVLGDSLNLGLLCRGDGVILSLALLGWYIFLFLFLARVLRIVRALCGFLIIVAAIRGVGAVLIFIVIFRVLNRY
jgi:hypothetical protein